MLVLKCFIHNRTNVHGNTLFEGKLIYEGHNLCMKQMQHLSYLPENR